MRKKSLNSRPSRERPFSDWFYNSPAGEVRSIHRLVAGDRAVGMDSDHNVDAPMRGV